MNRRNLQSLFLAGCVALCSALPATAHASEPYMVDIQVSSLHITEAYAYATHKKAKTAAIFFSHVDNQGDAVRIVKASSPASGRIELHEMAMTGDVMEMRELENGFPIPGKQVFDFNSKGYHFMLMDLHHPLEKGSMVELSFELEDGTSLTHKIPVIAVADAPAHKAGHSGH